MPIQSRERNRFDSRFATGFPAFTPNWAMLEHASTANEVASIGICASKNKEIRSCRHT
jgi:hypothetical protein